MDWAPQGNTFARTPGSPSCVPSPCPTGHSSRGAGGGAHSPRASLGSVRDERQADEGSSDFQTTHTFDLILVDFRLKSSSFIPGRKSITGFSVSLPTLRAPQLGSGWLPRVMMYNPGAPGVGGPLQRDRVGEGESQLRSGVWRPGSSPELLPGHHFPPPSLHPHLQDGKNITRPGGLCKIMQPKPLAQRVRDRAPLPRRGCLSLWLFAMLRNHPSLSHERGCHLPSSLHKGTSRHVCHSTC